MLGMRLYKSVRRLIETGLSLVAIGIDVQALFVGKVVFLPDDIVADISAKVADLGGYGLAGIVIGGAIFCLFMYVGVWRGEPKAASDKASQPPNSDAPGKSP